MMTCKVGTWALSWGWDLSIKAEIWTSQMRFEPRGWYLNLTDEIWALRLIFVPWGWVFYESIIASKIERFKQTGYKYGNWIIHIWVNQRHHASKVFRNPKTTILVTLRTHHHVVPFAPWLLHHKIKKLNHGLLWITRIFVGVTRPDTRPIPVADGWAEAECAFSHFLSYAHGGTDRWTDGLMDGRMDGPMDKGSYRVACPQL